VLIVARLAERLGVSVSGNKLAPNDAWWYWAGKKIPSDQFMVYAFDGMPAAIDQAVADLLHNARSTPDMQLRVNTRPFGSPSWARCEVDASQVVVHRLQEPAWPTLLRKLAALMNDQLDQEHHTWRVHVFPEIAGVPTAAGPATVAVLQISHSLADGILAAALAGRLFGRVGPIPEVLPTEGYGFVRRTIAARSAYKRLSESRKAESTTACRPPVPALSTNNSPAGEHLLGTVVVNASQLPGRSVAVGALVVVADALSSLLRDRGERVDDLTAEVPMTKPGVRRARNHFALNGVGLYPAIADKNEQLHRIIRDLESSRHGAHPSSAFRECAFAAVPGPLQRWLVLSVKWPHQQLSLVAGNTVVSRVHRGEADLRFGGCPVIFTTGYPALSPQVGLTHGVHSTGDTVAISVHTTRSVVQDLSDYLQRIEYALAR
jgi:WS/DGAT C-terminal domain